MNRIGVFQSAAFEYMLVSLLITIFSDCDPITISGGSSGDKQINDQVTLRCDAPCEPARNIVLKRTNMDGSETVLKVENGATQLSHNYILRKEDNQLHFHCDVEGRRSQSDAYFNVLCKWSMPVFMCQ